MIWKISFPGRSQMPKTNGLTDKQAAFVQEYLVDLNATQAAIRAGYSEHTAKDIGCQNLAKLNIAEAIAEAQEARTERTHVTTDMIIAGLLTEAMLKGDGSTPSSRVAAWSHLAKHNGMFIERQEVKHTGNDTVWTVKIVDSKPE